MNFNDVMAAARVSAAPTVMIPERWGQGRATFGGLLAAVLFERITAQVAQDRPVRSVLLSFVAPVAPGAMEVQVEVLREGKGATQVQATAYQNDQACAVLLASFGGERESMLSVEHEPAPVFAAPDEVQAFPFIAGLTPDFTRYFDYRYTLGKMPFMGSEQRAMGGWIRLREDSPSGIGVAALLALLDAWPPAVFSLLRKPASGSSLTWAISFVAVPQGCSANDWWQYQADIQSSAKGYSHIDARLWDKHGRLAVLSRQTVSVFA
ncbi:MAG TPA: thioesterase family protein [Pseudomonas sp.]|nr:thioesterase family protein [Pseudomonas sp.]